MKNNQNLTSDDIDYPQDAYLTKLPILKNLSASDFMLKHCLVLFKTKPSRHYSSKSCQLLGSSFVSHILKNNQNLLTIENLKTFILF